MFRNFRCKTMFFISLQVWLALADNYLHDLSIDWESTKRFTFNEKSNPDDNTLGLQIVKVCSSGFNLLGYNCFIALVFPCLFKQVVLSPLLVNKEMVRSCCWRSKKKKHCIVEIVTHNCRLYLTFLISLPSLLSFFHIYDHVFAR